MSTIQNLKNFIRHGKQARTANPPVAEPTTNVSNVHAQQHRNHNQTAVHHGISEPNLGAHHNNHQQIPIGPAGGYSTAGVDNKNAAARAADVTAKAQQDQQKLHQSKAVGANADYDPQVMERIVNEERDSRGKMPRYPGLERWHLVEKMGDGAFSNVYRARDTQHQYPEVAIKVVRKFEMNSNQVSYSQSSQKHFHSLLFVLLAISFNIEVCQRTTANMTFRYRVTVSFIPISSKRRKPKQWRCALTFPTLFCCCCVSLERVECLY